MGRSVNPVPQYFDNEGEPLALGKMFFFISGTTTPKEVYRDVDQTDPYVPTGEVELDGAGRLPNVFFDGNVRQVLEDANGVQIWEREPVESNGAGGALSPYDAQETYEKNDLVLGEDERYYRSLQNGNQNNEPSTSPTSWNPVQFLEFWNANITYSTGDNVKTTDGNLWRSLTDNNLGNDPLTSAEWSNVGIEAFAYISNYTVINGFGIESVVNDGGAPFNAAVITFTKSASAATAQTVQAVCLAATSDVYADPTEWTANTVTVRQESYGGGGENVTEPFVVIRYIA